MLGTITLSLTAELFWEGLKAGLLTFGGAYTVIPFLQESSVDVHHYLTDSQFIDGLAISGALPAPLIIFATFVGYVAGGLGGRRGDDARDLPPRVPLPDLLPPPAGGASPRTRAIRPFLLGVAAGVIGLIAAVTVDIVGTAIVDVPTALLAVGAFARAGAVALEAGGGRDRPRLRGRSARCFSDRRLRPGRRRKVGRAGIEPATLRLRVSCSTS